MSEELIKYSSFFSGPRWIPLEDILTEIMYENHTRLTIDKTEFRWLYKKVYFTIYPYTNEILQKIIKELRNYGI